MNAGSLVGFGVVFVLVCAMASALLAAVMHAFRAVLARHGPAAERRAAELVALLPVLVGFAVVAILAVESLIGVDHCGVHEHHAHLCLQHGAVWLDRPAAIVVVVAGAAIALTRIVVVFAGLVRGAALVRRLRRLAPIASRGARGEAKRCGESVDVDGVRVVTSERAFCFVAGILRPAIYVSTATRAALDDDEWAAMLAHEASHVRHRDLARRLAVELVLVFAAPLVGIVVRDTWDDATERLRDADAADAAGAPEPVASALVRMARVAFVQRGSAVASFTPRADRGLSARVESLLGRCPRGQHAARRLHRTVGAATVTVLLAAIVFAEPLHHALETLLG